MSGISTSSGARKWSILVYLAGDNNLETYGVKDLDEMNRASASAEVAVVAQFDRMSDQVTRRYCLRAGQSLEASCVAALGEVNTGDPAALLDFITWGCQNYPAERYGLILWNHGAGWKDTDIYQLARKQGAAEKITQGQVRGLSSGRISRALFSTTLERLIAGSVQGERAILFDDSSADFLDNLELSAVLQQAVQQIGRPLDLLGFDACLMNMLEVGYQVRDYCGLVVGSQEIEPGDGWPYDEILTRLAADPSLAPTALGEAIVEAYVRFYQTHHPGLAVTQSAILLSGIEAVAQAVSGLAQALTTCLVDPQAFGILFRALRFSQSFADPDYVDLAHFCQLLTTADPAGKIGTAAGQVADVLLGAGSPVIAESHCGSGLANAHGISIYLPARSLSSLYYRLEFAQKHAWDEFLAAFVSPDPSVR